MEFAGFRLRNNLFVAPMAGVTDRPFRQLCKRMGAGLAVSEMVTSNSLLYGSAKTKRRANHDGEVAPVAVQIAGADPQMMADAARYNVDSGAQIIDINMGCPAKKICNVMSGSALLQDEPLVGRILDAVVQAVPNTAVTLKIRTGWNRDNRNAPRVARIAEKAGIRALAIHGRTRADQYTGAAEYDTIALVKSVVNIPVIANGDIGTPQKARDVLDQTGCDGVMIGRAATKNPWIFQQAADLLAGRMPQEATLLARRDLILEHFLATGREMAPPLCSEILAVLKAHLADLYAFYGDETGLRIARKHISWYTKGLAGSANFRHAMNRLQTVEQQIGAIEGFFGTLAEDGERLRYAEINEDEQELAA